jgi:hypothetical protein
MGKRFGIVSRYRSHLARFRLSFYETKDVGGAWHDPIPGTVPMVSCFGDNRVGRAHPDWVQVGPDNQRATRDAPYFDWDALCPTRPEVQGLAREWIAKSRPGAEGLRLDDVTYARDGFCRCAVCEVEAKRRHMPLADLHRTVLTEFVGEARGIVPGPCYFTCYPDPYPGHLEDRYGIDVDALSPLVDVWVVPLYDLHYGTTYWLEVLAGGFRDRIRGQLYIELYGLKVPEAALAKAVRVAGHYADGVLVAYDDDLSKLERLAAGFAEEHGVALTDLLSNAAT